MFIAMCLFSLGVCVCVCVFWRQRDGKRGQVCVQERAKEGCVCACVYSAFSHSAAQKIYLIV